ncbi:MAG: FAD-binding oxidoreductase [Bryobacteraceae bacterium]
MPTETLSPALEQWMQLLGRKFVQYGADALAGAETATFATSQKIAAILQPGSREEIADCLKIASSFETPLYPISSGKNWGYGSRVPPVSGCVLLDLSRLNRIVDFDEDLGYVTVEPGVTQRQLFEFLRERRSNLWMDATGSSPDCSLIGNAMERGFGHTPYGDHFAHVCGLEIVLPNGEIVRTGAARFERSATAAVSRWGLGPSLDGLFSQSNLGIVTQMTIWLMPQPDAFEAFFFRSDAADGLAPLIDSLRCLRLQDVLRSSIHVANDYKVLGGIQQYPWQEMSGRTPIAPAEMASFRKKLSFGRWNASGALYGTPAQIAEAKRLLGRELRGQRGKLKYLSPRKLQTAKRFAGIFRLLAGWDLRRTISLVEPVLGLMQGAPMTVQQALRSAYWRKRIPVPPEPDPDRDRCGLLWYSPVAPAKGEAVAKLAADSSAILLECGFEPMISLTMLTPRLVCSVISISYDRELPGEDEKAAACYARLRDACSRSGYFPYRLGIHPMADLPESPGYAGLLKKLKKTLDPVGILAPGRYAPK